MVYCEKDGVVPVAEKNLPVILPDKVNVTLAGGSPLQNVSEFLNTTCPKCGGVATEGLVAHACAASRSAAPTPAA